MNKDHKLDSSLAKRILREHLFDYKRKFGIACIFMLLTALSTAALPYLLQPVFDDVFSKANPKLLVFFCGAVLAAFIIKGAASYGESVTMTKIGQGIISDIQERVFNHLMHLDLAFFHKNNSGELLSRLTNDVNLMRNSVANTIIGVGRDFFTFIALLAVMFSRDFTLAIISFTLFPLAFYPIMRIGKRMRKVTYNAQGEIGHFTRQLSQIFQGIRVIKSFNTQYAEIAREKAQIKKIYDLVVKTARTRALAHPIIETMGGVAIISIIAYGGWQVMHHDRSAGEFVSFIAALILAYEPLKRLSNLNASLQEGLAAANRVFELIDAPIYIHSPKDGKKPTTVKGTISFKNVDFSYSSKGENKGKKVLRQLNFRIEPGQTAAFVGASGAGKSTIINLIPRFYDTPATIEIDGIDVKHWDLKYLRQQIALVSQEILLFDTTIYENIAYGMKNPSKEEVISAAKQAYAHDFISKMPLAYETQVGEGGISLSGGQRQRIAIARAILKKAPILLLDEATSALDADSEEKIQASLKPLMQKCTTISVAHRLSTIQDMDVIYVLDNGRIIEQGNHQQLLQLNQAYAELWRKQNINTNFNGG